MPRPSDLTPAQTAYTELLGYLQGAQSRRVNPLALTHVCPVRLPTGKEAPAMTNRECFRALRELHWTLRAKACNKALLFLYGFIPGPPPADALKAFGEAQRPYQSALGVSVSKDRPRYSSRRQRMETEHGDYLFVERQPEPELGLLLVQATWKLFEASVTDANRARVLQATEFIPEPERLVLTPAERLFNLWWVYWMSGCAISNVESAHFDARLVGVDQLPFTDREKRINNRIVFNGRRWEALAHLQGTQRQEAEKQAQVANRSLRPAEGRWLFSPPPEPEVITGLEELD